MDFAEVLRKYILNGGGSLFQRQDEDEDEDEDEKAQRLLGVKRRVYQIMGVDEDEDGNKIEVDTSWLDRADETATPLYIAMGDRAAMQGNFDLAIELYTAYLRSPVQKISELTQAGRLFLRRARAQIEPETPSESAKKFDAYFHEDDYSDPIPIDAPFPIDPGVAFPESHTGAFTLLAAEAFARAMPASDVDDDMHVDDRNESAYAQELFALDGLRCSLILLDDVASLDVVVKLIANWVEDRIYWRDAAWWWVAEFESRGRETHAWLRGRRGQSIWGMPAEPQVSDSSATADVYGRMAVWQNTEILDLLRLQHDRDDLDRVKVLEPKDLQEQLSKELGQGWERLPAKVRRRITQAEWLRPIFAAHDGIDWAPVMIQYSRALEELLQDSLSEPLVRLLNARLNNKHQTVLRDEANRWSIYDYGSEIQKIASSHAQGKLAAGVSKSLKEFGMERNQAAHAGEFFDPARVRNAREALVGKDGLIWRIQALRL